MNSFKLLAINESFADLLTHVSESDFLTLTSIKINQSKALMVSVDDYGDSDETVSVPFIFVNDDQLGLICRIYGGDGGFNWQIEVPQ